MYEYEAKVVRVVDGDTVDALIDIGFSVWVKKRIRLYGINTPESRTRDLDEKKLGLAAKEQLKSWIEDNDNKITIKSHGVGKYGRCLGEIYTEGNDESLNKQLVKTGHAVEYFGGAR